MKAKELQAAKQQLARDILELVEQFHIDTEGFRVSSIHLNTVRSQEAGQPSPELIPSGVEIGIDI